MKFLGQLMMIVCDVLIMQRMSQGGGINIIVSIMCPVFHIYVAVLNAMSPSAYKKLQRCVLSQKVTVMSTPGNAAKLSLAQRAITFLLLLSCAAMFLLFVLFTPLFAPKNVRFYRNQYLFQVFRPAIVDHKTDNRLMEVHSPTWPVCTACGSATLTSTQIGVLKPKCSPHTNLSNLNCIKGHVFILLCIILNISFHS
jgi:hypothetical protein